MTTKKLEGNFSGNLNFQDEKNYLETKLLPHIEIDYLNVTFDNHFSRFSLEDQLKKIKPNLRVLDLSKVLDDQKTGKICDEEEVKFATAFYKQERETKYEEIKYDLILHQYYNDRVARYYGRVPGKLADLFMQEIFNGNVDVQYKPFKFTRFDFKLQLPDFSYKNYEYDRDLFLAFHEIQNLERFYYDDKKKFAIGYINSRESRRMIRMYISDSRNCKTFEMECKRDSAKKYMEFLMNKDFYGFNKTLVLELIEELQRIQECEFSSPILNYHKDFLMPLKNEFFPDESYYKKKN